MNKIVIFLMLISYCAARSIDGSGYVLDTPMDSLPAATSDIKSTDEIVEENLAQIEAESNIMDSPVNGDEMKRFYFSTTTAKTTTKAPIRPFTQTVDLLVVLNSMTMTARK